ncbi:MAG: 2-oxo acid dehydrogenase subunit E2, partial [Desulfobulbaceae bacterium]|nr:2-oxo acid dehydrogenase subunit E2 [Desulfobulbaceae bacterium]
PSLGADMETGKLVEWLVVPGQRVRRGDIVAMVETQKGLFEAESFADGVMGELLVQPGQTVPVGTVLATIDNGTAGTGEKPPAPPDAAAARAGAEPETAASVPTTGTSALAPAATPGRIACSPSARQLALELGVDLATVTGTGPHGAIGRGDVEAAARAAGTKPPAAAAPVSPAQAEPSAEKAADKPAPTAAMKAMRQAIAAAVSRSNREIPHYYLESEIDLSRPLKWLEEENRKRSLRERILPVALLVKAVALALREVPELNGFWQDDQLEVRPDIHIGFAVALRQGGLISPAVHHVDQLGVGEVMERLVDLIERTRTGHLRGSEMTDATVSVTSLGDRGVRTVYGVIYPPQVALIGFGRISERPWAEDGMLGVRRCVTATLAADHRATDGHQGALFLEALNRHLNLPETL